MNLERKLAMFERFGGREARGGRADLADAGRGDLGALHPVLVMAGELDPVCPLQDSLDIAAALSTEHMQIATFTHSGHGAWRDEPDAAFACLRRFILEP